MLNVNYVKVATIHLELNYNSAIVHHEMVHIY